MYKYTSTSGRNRIVISYASHTESTTLSTCQWNLDTTLEKVCRLHITGQNVSIQHVHGLVIVDLGSLLNL